MICFQKGVGAVVVSTLGVSDFRDRRATNIRVQSSTPQERSFATSTMQSVVRSRAIHWAHFLTYQDSVVLRAASTMGLRPLDPKQKLTSELLHHARTAA
eukprot:5007500-Amphidinium_carterae.1